MAAVAVLWTVLKARNAMVFKNERHDVLAIACRLQDCINPWVCRAPRRLDVEPLMLVLVIRRGKLNLDSLFLLRFPLFSSLRAPDLPKFVVT